MAWLHSVLMLLILSFGTPGTALAQRAPIASSAQQSSGGIASVVVADEAVIYSSPSFDAAPLGSLRRGQIIATSRRTFGDEVTFFRVRVGQRFGYIVTIDVDRRSASVQRAQERLRQAELRRKKQSAQVARGAKGSGKGPTDTKKAAEPPREPFVFTRYFGLLASSTLFREEIAGLDPSARLTMVGFKLTGPDVIMSGPLIDLNLTFATQPPEYYRPASLVSPTGAVVLADLLLMAPYRAKDHWAFYGGLGPHLSFVSVRLVGSDRVRSLTSLNLGLALYLGIGGRWGRWAARLEAKQIYERRGYHSVLLAIQTQLW